MEINLKIKRYEEVASNYYMMASIYSEEENYEKALEYANLALKYDKKVENSMGIAKDFLAIGLIYKKAGKYEESYVYFKKTLLDNKALITLYPDMPIENEVRTVLEYLIEIAEKLGYKEDLIEYKMMLGLSKKKE